MARIDSFEDLAAWQKARLLSKRVYECSRRSAFASDISLRNQTRRSAVSIMSNIAEGFERDGNKEFIQFLSTAKGSAGELRSQLYVALDQGYISTPEFDDLYGFSREISRMISGLIRYLRQSEQKGRKYAAARTSAI